MSKAAHSKAIHASGKRKRAIARATLIPGGNGTVHVNGVLLSVYGNELTRSRIMEPLILAGEASKKFTFKITSNGGGVAGQADAIRLALGRALSANDDKLRQKLLEYDRQLLIADVRRKESAKPNSHGQARAKTQKSYR